MSNVNFKEDADENIKLLYEKKEYCECLNQYKMGNQSFKSSTYILFALAAVETRNYDMVKEFISNFLALDGQPTLLVETLINKIKFVRELDDSKFDLLYSFVRRNCEIHWVYKQLSHAYEISGNFTYAIKYIYIALQINPKDYWSNWTYCHLLLLSNQFILLKNHLSLIRSYGFNYIDKFENKINNSLLD